MNTKLIIEIGASVSLRMTALWRNNLERTSLPTSMSTIIIKDFGFAARCDGAMRDRLSYLLHLCTQHNCQVTAICECNTSDVDIALSIA
jgi:hypothetical protein